MLGLGELQAAGTARHAPVNVREVFAAVVNGLGLFFLLARLAFIEEKIQVARPRHRPCMTGGHTLKMPPRALGISKNFEEWAALAKKI